MLFIKRLSFFLCLALLSSQCQEKLSGDKDELKNILVFSKTAEFRHESIEAGVITLKSICNDLNIIMEHSEDASLFQKENLEKYQLVLFLSTTGDILNNEQQTAFENYLKAGGNFMGVHSATDTEYDWPWYNKLVGAYFVNHPAIQKASVNVLDVDHIACKHLPNPWVRTGEWYNFKSINPDVHVLLTIDESSYEGGTNGDNHPYAWCHEFEKGRSFYTACGHTIESFSEPEFIKHLEGGITWCLGLD
jgi:type 1 glutamine amidotransferase